MNDIGFRRMMKVILEKEKEEHFLELARQGSKLPPSFNVESIIMEEEETPITLMAKQMQAVQREIQEMKNKDKVSSPCSLDSICPFTFDKNLYIPPFPSRTEIPKLDKYDGNSDPQDHARELCALCMELMHEQTYLMHLFLRSLGG